MAVAHIEVLVEEPSMEMALRALLPKIVGDTSFSVHPHQGKRALLERLPHRLRAYRRFLPLDWLILVVIDRDDDDCRGLKRQIVDIATEAGLRVSTRGMGGHAQLVARIATEELESWYFGDWEAVCAAFPRVPRHLPARAKFRVPDVISGGTWEAFERTMQGAGYVPGGLRKIEAAQRICPLMIPEQNLSQSFQMLRSALTALVA